MTKTEFLNKMVVLLQEYENQNSKTVECHLKFLDTNEELDYTGEDFVSKDMDIF
jgi:hypothetical protein